MFKKFKILSTALAVGVLLTGCGPKPVTPETTRIQDDLYQAVNEEWLSKAEIPSDSPSVGAFDEIEGNISATLKEDFDTMVKEKKESDIPEVNEFLKLYQLARDYERRNKEGVEALRPVLEKVERISSFEDLNTSTKELILDSIATPLNVGVDTDMKHSNTKAFYFAMPELFLGDKSHYEAGDETGEKLTKAYEDMLKKMLAILGEEETKASIRVEEAMKFDRMLSEYGKTAEEAGDPTLLYNPMKTEEFIQKSNQLDLQSLIISLTGHLPEQVIVADTKYYDHFNELVTPENFDLIKSWMYVQVVTGGSPYLSEEFEEVGNQVSMAMSGVDELAPPEDRAFSLAEGQFSEAIGVYYGKTYFGEEAKKDVTDMTKEFIETYKKRLENTEWLTETTRNKAVKKLDTMTVQIGYPELSSEEDNRAKIDVEKSLFENINVIARVGLEESFASFSKSVDREEWGMSAHEVNAAYSPLTNTITFPAAILQAPFYSQEQSDSANYGGIGAVIAHEISHAFDPNGSKFDENGNMVDWWTEEDYAAFAEKTEAMKKQFDGLETSVGKVNGALTVGENVADSGGVSVALEVAKKSPDVDLEEFFTNWATIWRKKSTPEYEKMILLDEHAPSKIRANMQASNVEDFYTTFDVKEGDGMYLPPEERVSVW